MRDNRFKLAILAALVVLLGVAVFLILRGRNNDEQAVAGANIASSMDILDLSTPLYVVADEEGNVYVSNTGKSTVAVFNSSGDFLYNIDSGQEPDGTAFQIYAPYGLAVDEANDRLYVCDYELRVFNKEGDYLYKIAPPPEAVTDTETDSAIRPNEVALTSDKVYVTSRDGIYIFDAKDGKYLDHWGTRGDAVGQYDFPNGIAVDQQTGNMFVVDVNNWRLVSLTKDGKIRWIIGTQDNGAVKSPFRLPRSVTVGPDGLVYVSDDPDRILVFDQDGNLVSILGERGTAETQLNFPEGLYVSQDNRLYIADRQNNRVQIWELVDQISSADDEDVQNFKNALRNY